MEWRQWQRHINRQTDSQSDSQIVRQSNSQTVREIYRMVERWTDKQTAQRHTYGDQQTDRWSDGQMDRQTDRHITDRFKYVCVTNEQLILDTWQWRMASGANWLMLPTEPSVVSLEWSRKRFGAVFYSSLCLVVYPSVVPLLDSPFNCLSSN